MQKWHYRHTKEALMRCKRASFTYHTAIQRGNTHANSLSDSMLSKRLVFHNISMPECFCLLSFNFKGINTSENQRSVIRLSYLFPTGRQSSLWLFMCTVLKDASFFDGQNSYICNFNRLTSVIIPSVIIINDTYPSQLCKAA